jgi:MHS family proline/betaine transporter-like MFS transporter
VTSHAQSPIRTAFAGLIGNVLEWFDFAVYGYFATAIGKQFFPSSDPTAQLLLSYLVFAIGFFARPVGSLVLGPVGDRIGRRALLTLSIALMGGATLVIGVLPTYATIGVAAPILLVLMRLIQGFSLGGEFTGSMVYTTELASPLKRGLISSSTAAGTTLGFLLGSITALIIRESLGEVAANAWGWRIPFIGSVLFCLAGWLLRRGIQEPAETEAAKAVRAPIWSSLAKDVKPILQTFGIVAMTNAAYYLTFTFAGERRISKSGLSPFAANVISLSMVLISKPLGGWLSDRIGRKRMMLGLTVLTMAITYTSLSWMFYGTANEFLLGQFLIGIPTGLALGMQGAMLVEIFPLRTRVTSMSVAYSVTLALSGGIAPFVSTWMMDRQQWAYGPVYYVLFYGVLALIALIPMAETNARRLDEIENPDGSPIPSARVA